MRPMHAATPRRLGARTRAECHLPNHRPRGIVAPPSADCTPEPKTRMFFPIEEWFPAFVLTVLVEGVVVLYGFRDAGVALLRLALLILFANLATHPAVWFVFTQLFLVGTVAYLVAAEGWAIGMEALFYWAVLPGLSPRRVIAVAVAANAASFAIGRAINAWLPDLLRLPS